MTSRSKKRAALNLAITTAAAISRARRHGGTDIPRPRIRGDGKIRLGDGLYRDPLVVQKEYPGLV